MFGPMTPGIELAQRIEQAQILVILHACIDRAVYELSDPIDRIEVLPNKIVVSARGKRVVLIAQYANGISPSGAVAPGSGRWVVDVAKSEP